MSADHFCLKHMLDAATGLALFCLSKLFLLELRYPICHLTQVPRQTHKSLPQSLCLVLVVAACAYTSGAIVANQAGLFMQLWQLGRATHASLVLLKRALEGTIFHATTHPHTSATECLWP